MRVGVIETRTGVIGRAAADVGATARQRARSRILFMMVLRLGWRDDWNSRRNSPQFAEIRQGLRKIRRNSP
jgi:hypothetical protein